MAGDFSKKELDLTTFWIPQKCNVAIRICKQTRDDVNNTGVQLRSWFRTGRLRSGDRRAKFIANTVQGGSSCAPPDLTAGSWAFVA